MTMTKMTRGTTVEVHAVGEIYGAPCTPGMVAPTGTTGTFVARGTLAVVGRAWRAWKSHPCEHRGAIYPRRWLWCERAEVTVHMPDGRAVVRPWGESSLASVIAEAIADARGVSYGAVIGDVTGLID